MAESHDGGSRNPLKPNRSVSTKMQDVILKVDAFAYRGKAVAAMPSGKRCFIRGGAPGDVLAVEIVKEKTCCFTGHRDIPMKHIHSLHR